MSKLIKIIYIIIFLTIISLAFSLNVESKYVIEENYEIINIKNVDSESPYINEKNYDVNGDLFDDDVVVNYRDNLKVKYAKYWYNSNSNNFEGEGTEFDSGTTFSLEGAYKVEVSDMYSNITTYIFYIDKEFNSIELSCTNITDEGGTLKIEATDVVTGVQKIELYINEELYKSYSYDELFVNSQTEELFINIDDLPFYEEAYVVATDFYGNSKISGKIIPNKNRIYDLQDLIKFQTVVNSEIDSFSDETVYLLNSLDLSSICSETLGNWETINENFLGTFDGENYTISNLYINTTTSYSGFFSILCGTVQNLNLSGKIISSRQLYRRNYWIFIYWNNRKLC